MRGSVGYGDELYSQQGLRSARLLSKVQSIEPEHTWTKWCSFHYLTHNISARPFYVKNFLIFSGCISYHVPVSHASFMPVDAFTSR